MQRKSVVTSSNAATILQFCVYREGKTASHVRATSGLRRIRTTNIFSHNSRRKLIQIAIQNKNRRSLEETFPAPPLMQQNYWTPMSTVCLLLLGFAIFLPLTNLQTTSKTSKKPFRFVFVWLCVKVPCSHHGGLVTERECLQNAEARASSVGRRCLLWQKERISTRFQCF
jgi:hypothetical protein